MIRIRNNKIKVRGTADDLALDFAILCTWFYKRVLLPTFNDKERARYKLNRLLDDALRNAEEMED